MELNFNGTPRASITVGDYTVLVVLNDYGVRATKTRLYVDGEDRVDFEPAYAATRADRDASENGYALRGDNKETDRLFDRLNREVVKNKRAVLAEAVEAIPELAEMLEGTKQNFSRRAGCSCPCSPGFVIDSVVFAPYLTYTRPINSIFVTRRTATETEVAA